MPVGAAVGADGRAKEKGGWHAASCAFLRGNGSRPAADFISTSRYLAWDHAVLGPAPFGASATVTEAQLNGRHQARQGRRESGRQR